MAGRGGEGGPRTRAPVKVRVRSACPAPRPTGSEHNSQLRPEQEGEKQATIAREYSPFARLSVCLLASECAFAEWLRDIGPDRTFDRASTLYSDSGWAAAMIRLVNRVETPSADRRAGAHIEGNGARRSNRCLSTPRPATLADDG
ncbi:unnamed protein product, partial [Iphiclides podalirius]